MKILVDELMKLSRKPELYKEGEPLFWNDPHISKNMLKVHLDGSHDMASRKTTTIRDTVDFLFTENILSPGMRVLDLGCGPGLYSEYIQQSGVDVVGIDVSKSSISYAKKRSQELNIPVDYYCMDFFNMLFEDEFDAVIQIYGEINTFSPRMRDKLMELVHRALKKDGKFIFDVTTRNYRKKHGIKNSWYVSDDGFWSSGKHIVLEQGYDYPDDEVWLDQYIVINDEETKIYRNWFRDYDLTSIEGVLDHCGFEMTKYWNDLTGNPYVEGNEWIAILANKK